MLLGGGSYGNEGENNNPAVLFHGFLVLSYDNSKLKSPYSSIEIICPGWLILVFKYKWRLAQVLAFGYNYSLLKLFTGLTCAARKAW